MKSIIILIATLFTVNGDISHILNKFRPSNSYLPPQRQPHSEYGIPSQGAQNYYSNIPESFVRINNDNNNYNQPSTQYGAPGPSYRQRPAEIQTIYVKDITQTYRPSSPPLVHQPAPLLRQPIPVFQPSIQPIYRPPQQTIQNIPVFQPNIPQVSQPILQPPIIRQPAPVYQAAPIQQVPIQQYPIQQNPIQQYPIQQNPIQQYPIQQVPIQQYPIQQTPIQQYPIQQNPIQPSNEYLPPLSSPNFALPSPEPAPSFHSGSTVAVLPSVSSNFIGKTSFGVSSIGSSGPSSEYLSPVQQSTFNVQQSGGDFGFSSGAQGSSTFQEPISSNNLGPDGYTYKRPCIQC